MSRFRAKGTYLSFGVSGGLIGGFSTLAAAKRACSRDELSRCGAWKKEDSSNGEAYFANNGCTVLLRDSHRDAAKYTPEEIEKATARFNWRESLR